MSKMDQSLLCGMSIPVGLGAYLFLVTVASAHPRALRVAEGWQRMETSHPGLKNETEAGWSSDSGSLG